LWIQALYKHKQTVNNYFLLIKKKIKVVCRKKVGEVTAACGLEVENLNKINEMENGLIILFKN